MKRQGLGTFVTGHAYGEQFASWLDRRWFDARPYRRCSLRAATANELKEMFPCTHIIVRKISINERHRYPVDLRDVSEAFLEKLADNSPEEVILDAVLEEIAFIAHRGSREPLNSVVQRVLNRFIKRRGGVGGTIQ